MVFFVALLLLSSLKINKINNVIISVYSTKKGACYISDNFVMVNKIQHVFGFDLKYKQTLVRVKLNIIIYLN